MDFIILIEPDFSFRTTLIMVQGKLISDGAVVVDSEIKEIINGEQIEKLENILQNIRKEEKHL